MSVFALNEDWFYAPQWDHALVSGAIDTATLTRVRVPHAMTELPADSFAETDYQHLVGYVRALHVPVQWQDKSVVVRFAGLAHHAQVFCNGTMVGEHACGYTAAEFDVTPHLVFGEANVIVVRLDSRPFLDQPPFGGVVDFATSGGMYREVELLVRDRTHLLEVFAYGSAARQLHVQAGVSSEEEGLALEGTLILSNGRTVAIGASQVADRRFATTLDVSDADVWNIDEPVLHELTLRLIRGEDVIDEWHQRIAFRTAEFRADAFYLNGKPVFLRGLNRHQSYPYLGYAAPARAQRRDADILRYELGCNVVRTSHYPQSHHFLDRCDEIGLLVITEIPGWQHIGGGQWQRQAVTNTRDMVLQWRNHPSIIAWGVRINESADNDDLYAKTNAVAHELDPTRQTTGVRNFAKSSLLEDVYGYNDFSHTGKNPGVVKRDGVTPDPQRGYVVSEHTGHVYPTKAGDDEAHRVEHAMRHARVMSDAAQSPGIAGVIGWCMFDYNTQRDFGSGDRVCHHGVMDMFRNPKLAAAVYASQTRGGGIVLEPSSAMNFGDWAAGAHRQIVVFTNAERVKMYRNDQLVSSFAPAPSLSGLPHAPVLIDDLIGNQLHDHESLTPRTATWLKQIFLHVAVHGLADLPLVLKARLRLLLLTKQVTMADVTGMFDTYLGSWGGKAVTWRFDAINGSEVVDSVTRGPGQTYRLDVDVDTVHLAESATWDMASIRFRLVDQYGAVQTYARRSVHLEIEGEAEIVGPTHVPLAGGVGGTFVRTVGRAGSARLVLSTAGAEGAVIDFATTVGNALPSL